MSTPCGADTKTVCWIWAAHAVCAVLSVRAVEAPSKARFGIQKVALTSPQIAVAVFIVSKLIIHVLGCSTSDTISHVCCLIVHSLVIDRPGTRSLDQLNLVNPLLCIARALVNIWRWAVLVYAALLVFVCAELCNAWLALGCC